MEEIEKRLSEIPRFIDRLKYIKATDGLEIGMDNGWYWIEYNGKEVEGYAGEMFKSSEEMASLLIVAGLCGKKGPWS